MHQNQFVKTKTLLKNNLNHTFNKIQSLSSEFNSDLFHQRLIDGQPPIIRMYYNCYQFNSNLIGIVNQIVEAIEVGEINNIENYTESDLYLTKTIYAIHNDHGTINTVKIPDILELEEIVLLLQKQIRYLTFIVELFPESLGTNYRKSISGIAEIPLDLYQIIHLCCLNMKSQIEKAEIQKEVFSALQSKPIRKKVC